MDSYIKAQEKLLKRCDDVYLETHAVSISDNCGFVEWTMGLKIILVGIMLYKQLRWDP